MNERIKELAKQADVWVDEDMLFHDILNPKTEKFAELIVAECLKKVEEEYKPVLEDKEMMKDAHWDGYVQCGVDSYVAIREHFFGIEE